LNVLAGRFRSQRTAAVWLAAGLLLLWAASAHAQSSQPDSQAGKTPATATQKSGSQSQPAPKAPENPPQLKLENPTAPAGKPGQKLETPKPEKPTPSEAAKPAPPNQEIVERVIFRGNRRIPSSRLRSIITTQAGQVYNVNRLERDFMALYNTGHFDDIRLEKAQGKTGVIVIFYLREKKLVRAITYKGLSTVSQSDILEAFKKEKIPLSIDSEYDPVIVKRAEVIIKEMLSGHGRQFATIRARTRNIPPESVALTFIVNEGPKVKVGKINFVGNTVFPNRKLVEAMKLSRPIGLPPWFYIFHKTYDHDKVMYDLSKVRDLYQDHGYFFALPEEPKVKMRNTSHRWPFFFWSWGHGKRVDITIPIEEGAQYRLGTFRIEGNKLFKAKQLEPFLEMKTGNIFDVSKMRDGIKNLTKLYGAYGYINFVATPDPEPDRKKHVVNLTLDFDEGQQFFVHRIEFSGNTKTRDKVIRRELLVDEGGIFNSRLWDLSILRVNQLGFFNEIKQADYDIKQNPQNHTVDITLKVKEKGRNSIGFSGGVSGLAGNFVGFNYATNNFLGLGETLSMSMEFGTYQKLYQFGFTEPYLMDRPITTGFTIFKSDYNYNELRQTSVLTQTNLTALQNTAFGQSYFQNFTENSSGFTAFASYPLRRTFARVGMTYSYTTSSLQAFSTASQTLFSALNFTGIAGPNQLAGINTSQIMPTYLYNTVSNPYNPRTGKYIYAALGFSGSVLGGNVNTVQPIFEFKYFHPINKDRNVLGFHVFASTVSGFGGKVPPPFSRFYMGGEFDLRGFDIRTISPIAFFPTIGSVCNRDNAGNIIQGVGSNGVPNGTCGSTTKFPYNTIIFPGGDTEVYTNFEYRIPIAGPVTLAYFIDTGVDFVWRPSQLKIQQTALNQLHTQFPNFPTPSEIHPISATNFQPRSSTGLELQVILPVMNVPFRIFYGYNWLRLNTTLMPPQDLPARSLFPNDATYDGVLPYFEGIPWRDRRSRVGFTVARTF
jgi:outer membrane protein insertion porin family